MQLINCQGKSGTMPFSSVYAISRAMGRFRKAILQTIFRSDMHLKLWVKKNAWNFTKKIRLVLVHYASLSYLCPCKQESLCDAWTFPLSLLVKSVFAQCISGICMPDEDGGQYDGPQSMPYLMFAAFPLYDIYRLCWSDWDTHQLLPTTENASVQWRAGATL